MIVLSPHIVCVDRIQSKLANTKVMYILNLHKVICLSEISLYFSAIIKPVSIGRYSFDVIYDVIASMQTLKNGTPEATYLDVYIDTFIFFLRSLCKIIWMKVHYFPNAPRTNITVALKTVKNESQFLYRNCIECICAFIHYISTLGGG